MNLGDVLTEAASGPLDLETVTAAGGAVTWARDGRPFAVLSADGDAAEFGLDPAVAAAAARTPAVVASDRGTGWVIFRPASLDDHGLDRATAWFMSAYRRLASD